jgi:hypothetical protein
VSHLDEDLPIGLDVPDSGRFRQPFTGNDASGQRTGIEEQSGSETAWAQNGPAETQIDITTTAARGVDFLNSGPSLTVIPQLEPTVPWMGVPKWTYKLIWKPLGKEDHLPKLNRKNQLDYEIDYLEARLRQLANVAQITVGVHNSIGGSGKSTTAIYLATIINDLTGVLAYAMSATSNLRTTALARYAGVESAEADGQAQRVHELVKLPKRDIDLRTVGKMVRRSVFGVRVVAEDRPKGLEKSTEFKTPQFVKVADAIHDVSELVVFDCGNDNVEPGSIPLEVARREDVMVLPANVENELSLEKLAEELAIYSDDASPDAVPLNQGIKPRIGRQIRTREKAERSVVIFTNASPHHKTEDFVAKYLPGNFRGVVLMVPKDSYITPSNPSTDPGMSKLKRPADPYKIDKFSTYHAFLEAAVAVFEMGARLQGLELPPPPHVAE